MFWPPANDGKYTCKSGYRFLREEVDLEQHEESEIQDKQLYMEGDLVFTRTQQGEEFYLESMPKLLPTKVNLV